MKLWQYLALPSGTIIAIVMALASVSYNATLGTPEPAFAWLPIVTNTGLFSALALAFDLGMIASVFGFLHWRHASRAGAALCIALFAIASLFSVHSVRGYIALNLSKTLAPAARAADVYQSLSMELRHDQEHMVRLRAKLLDAKGRRDRRRLESDVEQLARTIHDTRSRLARTKTGAHVSPLAGLEWFLAMTLWFFNATCWYAWFGDRAPAPHTLQDTVTGWLAGYDLGTPQHCAVLYDSYRAWCTRRRAEPLAQYSFYARLVELGAKKFRDGRNGPTKYVMPQAELPG
jgi:hypothetical protein